MTAVVATRVNSPRAMSTDVNESLETSRSDQLSLRLSCASPLGIDQNVSSPGQGPIVVRRVSMSGVYLRRRLAVCLTALALMLILAPVVRTVVVGFSGAEKESS